MTQGSIRGVSRYRALPAMAAALALAAGMAGCKVNVQKGANGQDKDVQVETPFGGLHVATNQLTAADLGLPVYPGANITPDHQNDKSANVHIGFGEWEMRVRVVNYATSDTQEKVVAFYKKALGRYGDVIECQDNSPVGTPTVTTEGLTCSDGGDHGHMRVNAGTYSNDQGGFQLKAGSKRHQHIVAFRSSRPGETRFVLVELELPASAEGGSGKSD
jgi:hypothetical protein